MDDSTNGPNGVAESRPDGPSSRPGPTSRPRTSPSTAAELASALDEIDAMGRRGDWQGVLAACDHWLALGANGDDRRSLEAFRFQARRNLLQTLTLDGFVRVERSHITIGQPGALEILFVNLSGRDVRILAKADGATPSALHLELSCLEIAADGTRVEDRRTEIVEVGEDINLGPGERKSFKVGFPTDDRDLRALSLRRFTISATLWPARLEVAGEAIPGGIRLRGGTIDAFPGNWEHLAQNPLSRLHEAITKRSSVHIPLCVALIAEKDREAARDELARVLLEQGADAAPFGVKVAACVGLRMVTGLELPADPLVWLKKIEEGFRP